MTDRRSGHAHHRSAGVNALLQQAPASQDVRRAGASGVEAVDDRSAVGGASVAVNGGDTDGRERGHKGAAVRHAISEQHTGERSPVRTAWPRLDGIGGEASAPALRREGAHGRNQASIDEIGNLRPRV